MCQQAYSLCATKLCSCRLLIPGLMANTVITCMTLYLQSQGIVRPGERDLYLICLHATIGRPDDGAMQRFHNARLNIAGLVLLFTNIDEDSGVDILRAGV